MKTIQDKQILVAADFAGLALKDAVVQVGGQAVLGRQ
mgnify:CR=1 FL=1